MSTLHNSAGRMLTWVRRHVLGIVAGALVLGFAVAMFVTTFRIYDERQARLGAIEALAAENLRQNVAQCEAINASNQTLRELLDVSIRRRPAGSLTAEDRQIAIDTYRRLPFTNCATGERTDFDPPFPS